MPEASPPLRAVTPKRIPKVHWADQPCMGARKSAFRCTTSESEVTCPNCLAYLKRKAKQGNPMLEAQSPSEPMTWLDLPNVSMAITAKGWTLLLLRIRGRRWCAYQATDEGLVAILPDECPRVTSLKEAKKCVEALNKKLIQPAMCERMET